METLGFYMNGANGNYGNGDKFMHHVTLLHRNYTCAFT